MFMKITNLAYLMRKLEFFDACLKEKENPRFDDENYKIILKTRISLARARISYVKEEQTFLNEVFYPALSKTNFISFPSHIIENIVFNLNFSRFRKNFSIYIIR